MAASCQHLWGVVDGREKVGNIFSFGVPWKIAVEMRLCFMAVIQAQNAVDRRDREKETGSGQQKQDSCKCSMRDAGKTTRADPICEHVLGKRAILGVFRKPQPPFLTLAASIVSSQACTMRTQRLWIMNARANKVVKHSAMSQAKVKKRFIKHGKDK